jgi:hypothetical protein
MIKRFLMALLGLAMVGGLSAQAPRPGYLGGSATTAAGLPLEGVRIRVFGTTDAGQRSSLNVRTKADGTFSLRLPSGNFSVREAVWPVKHSGRSYALPLYLEGENTDDFDSTEGAVVRLVLKMSGKADAERSDADERAWFGGTIELEHVNTDGTPASSLPESATWSLTLTPRGNLMDGTPAKTLSYTGALNLQRANRFILDVPLADYDAEAVLVTGGAAVPLLLASREAVGAQTKTPLAKTVPVTFAPASGEVTLKNGSGVVKSVVQMVIPAAGAARLAPASVAGDAPVADGPAVAAWAVGDHVNVLRTPRLAQWHAGRIRAVKDGLYLIKFDAFGEEHNEWVDASRIKALEPIPAAEEENAPAAAAWRTGDRVNVLRTPRLQQWHTGRIRAVKDGEYLIKFDAFGEEHNEWVDASRIKAL